MKPIIWIYLGLALLLPTTRAASFDCVKAATKMEELICGDAQLSKSDEELAKAYSKALKEAEDPAAIKKQQREWLTDVRKRCDDKTCLNGAYSTRMMQLATVNLDGIIKTASASPAIVKTLQNANISVPYVETTPPEAGRNINAQVLGMPEVKSFSAAQEAFAKQPTEDSGLISESYSVVRNDGRLLVMQFETEGCGAYCSTSSEQKIFDVRTGHLVHPEELFTDQGAAAISRRLKDNRIQRGKIIVARLQKESRDAESDDGELDMYQGCLSEWAQWEPSIWSMSIDADGRWRFVSGSCSNHAMRPFDALDNLDQIVAIPELKPHLNPYGKSLLLGEGDVRDSAPAPVACKDGEGVPVRNAMRPAGPEIIASAGEDHHLLLQRNGQLWAWGRNDDGQLGNDGHKGKTPVPVLVGSDFIQAAAGQFFSAGIRRDGTLWTWGSNYEGRLGDGGTKSQVHPVRIGENFTTLKLETNDGMALDREGSLWIWGSNTYTPKELVTEGALKPKKLMIDVAQMEYGPYGERLILKKDGSIWAIGGFSAEAQKNRDNPWQPWLIGHGFSRLAARHGDLAFKADGSLWAWGETLAGMYDTQGQRDQGPIEVGRDYVNVKVAPRANLFVAALKADGSLWASHLRGATIRMEQVGCGFADVVAGSGHVLALKQDGNLQAWGNWNLDENWAPNKQMFSGKPLNLGKGYSKLFQVGGLFGSGGAHAIALKTDGTVWQRNETPKQGAVSAQDMMLQVPFAGNGKLPQ